MNTFVQNDSGPEGPTSQLPSLHLITLGALRLVASSPSGDVVLYDGANKALALFTYLACAPGRGATRAHLQELLWERQSPEAAQQSLRTYLWKLRKLLPPNSITGDEFVVLSIDCQVDRDALLEAANRGDAGAVVQRFTGDFFPSHAQPDSPQFDAWVQSERLRLRDIFSRCVERVVTDAVDGGEFRQAIEVARRLRDVDPLDERGWRPLLNALLVSGDSVNAANESAVLVRALAADDQEPLPATTSLLNAIARMARREDSAVVGVDFYVTPLIARDREFSQLLASWLRVRADSFAHVHVHGVAGVGKSRLLDDFASRLLRDRAVVVRARTDIGRRTLPYAFVGTIAAQLAARRGAAAISPGSKCALLAVNPALSNYFSGEPDSSTGADALRRRTLAVSELVTAVSDEQPLAILLDDMQWADTASCAVLAGSISASETTSCLLITAGREELPAVFSESRCDEITLNGLNGDALIDLLQSLATLPDLEWANEFPRLLHQSSAGLPLQVFDALRLATERGLLGRDRQTWVCSEPAALAEMLLAGSALPRRIRALSATQREALLQLAVAGEPCDVGLLRSRDVASTSDVEADLVRLERLGYVSMIDSCWCVAHDAIGEVIVGLSSDAAVALAHESLGRGILAAIPPTLDSFTRHSLRAVVNHAVEARSMDLLRESFGRYLLVTRAQRDRSPLPLIADEALGNPGVGSKRSLLISSLTVRRRLADMARIRWRGAAAATGIAVAAGLLGALAVTRPTPVPIDGYLAFLAPGSAGVTTVREVPLRSQDWPLEKVVDTEDARDLVTLPNDPLSYNAVPTGETTGEFIGSLAQSDSGTIDLYLFRPGRAPQRLTAARGDDVDPSLSPDGRQVAFASARWSAVASRSIAILDRRTLAVKRLTDAAGSDEAPSWSPDGRRIAFTRRGLAGERLCIATVDGQSVVCPREFASHEVVRTLAWHDESIVFATVDRMYARVHVDSATMTVLDSGTANRTVSPDGRWLAVERSASRQGDVSTCEISPAAAPSLRRSVHFTTGKSSGCPPFLWSRARRDLRMVTEIQIDTIRSGPFVAVPYRLTARARRAGVTGRSDHITWSTSDSTIAAIDSTGVLEPRRAGVVLVRASYGGWRTDSIVASLVVSNARVLLSEGWRNDIGQRWKQFGMPTPQTVALSDGVRGFLNNGDGIFQSGVHSRSSFPIDGGLAIETWVSAAITMDRWQVVRLGIFTDIDSVGLSRWNHVDGWAFAPGREALATCEFQYPSGSEGTQSYSERFMAASQQLPAPASWRSGERIGVVLQLLPDGRCGVAINGQVVGYSSNGSPTRTHSAHVFIYGNSPGTRVVTGPLTVSAGVVPGIQWNGAPKRVVSPSSGQTHAATGDRPGYPGTTNLKQIP
ncbi:AAA family ATPase [Gemmatimonas sp.]|uniref:AAA family ATPase n=1 Tax=Gemmatimonas sp. TaxID=1962908 RepID=UPI00286E4933|nr:AAA family ATPase [Gemmatimonas sp.]